MEVEAEAVELEPEDGESQSDLDCYEDCKSPRSRKNEGPARRPSDLRDSGAAREADLSGGRRCNQSS